MINLEPDDVRWIKLIKNHYEEKYPVCSSSWIRTLQPMFDDVYTYKSSEYYSEFLECMFNKLLDIYMKIQCDGSGCHNELKTIFKSSFDESGWRRSYKLPIERAIAELCGQIQCNRYRDDDGNKRYDLTERKELRALWLKNKNEDL